MGMTQANATIGLIQSELTARVGMVSALSARRHRDMAIEIGAIRQIAHRHGLHPAVAVSQVLESALARGERGTLIQGWLALLGEAIGCDRQDRAASEIFVAAGSVRFSA